MGRKIEIGEKYYVLMYYNVDKEECIAGEFYFSNLEKAIKFAKKEFEDHDYPLEFKKFYNDNTKQTEYIKENYKIDDFSKITLYIYEKTFKGFFVDDEEEHGVY